MSLRLAFLSRLITLLLWYVSDQLIPDHNASGVSHFSTSLENSVFNSFVKWDAAHYLTISKYGYTTEQSFAFFPIFPYSIRYTEFLLRPILIQFCTYDERLVFAGLTISNLLFVGNVLVFEIWCKQLFYSPRLTRLAIVLFCFNPASVFFSAIYTESIYCFFNLIGIVCLNRSNYSVAALALFLASGIRSNGILNAIPIMIDILYDQRYLSFKLVVLVFIVLPAFLWNFVIAARICSDDSVYDHPCTNYLPNMYGYIQQKYWNVGFLRQYEFRQLPNFLLASPVIIYSVYFIGQVYSRIRTPMDIKYASHLLGVILLGTLFAHVQICTRMIFSSCPIVFLFFSSLFDDSDKETLHKFRPNIWLLNTYFLGFYSIGIFLHSNFYPWT
jgi:GPI mannosyltransferase 2